MNVKVFIAFKFSDQEFIQENRQIKNGKICKCYYPHI